MNNRSMWPLSSVAVVILIVQPITAWAQASATTSGQASTGPASSPNANSGTGTGASGTAGGGASVSAGRGAAATDRPSAATVGATGTAAAGTTVVMPPFGWPTNPTKLNAHLPSSSRPTSDINRPTDGFDLADTGGEAAIMRGSDSASVGAPSSSMSLPGIHVVKQGDTLWDLCDQYFQNPWEWPRVWSYNPELQNPHWIYPGDRVRLRPPTDATGDHRMLAAPTRLGKGIGRSAAVPPNTVFLRDQGYLDDEATDVWGEIGGSPEDQLLLTDGDFAYIEVAPRHDPVPGQELSVFRPTSRAPSGEKGTMVAILGTAKVERWDPKTRVARARLTESLNVIERGAKVGPVSRRFEVVPPLRNEVELAAQIVASFYPHVLYGQNQLVFINRGSKDGIMPGNRFMAVTRGDPYRQTLGSASRLAAARVEYHGDMPARIVENGAVGTAHDEAYPTEVVGELRVLSVRDHTAACLVTASQHELERGQAVIARKGY